MMPQGFRMHRSLLFLQVVLLLVPAWTVASAETCAYQGIYEGKELFRVDGQAPAYFPSRLTVLPDGHSIIVTSQIVGKSGKEYIITRAATGNFTGNVFTGFTRGRFNLGSYGWSGTYLIGFVGNQARVKYESTNRPSGYVEDPREAQERIFYRTKS
jgi:hypothetical protein